MTFDPRKAEDLETLNLAANDYKARPLTDAAYQFAHFCAEEVVPALIARVRELMEALEHTAQRFHAVDGHTLPFVNCSQDECFHAKQTLAAVKAELAKEQSDDK